MLSTKDFKFVYLPQKISMVFQLYENFFCVVPCGRLSSVFESFDFPTFAMHIRVIQNT